MLRFSKRQAQAPLLIDRQALIEDLEAYLADRYPTATRAIPRGLLWAILNETARIAFWLRIYDVEHIRFLAALRLDIAPGFYREPRLWSILAAIERDEAERMDALAAQDLEAAWQGAIGAADSAHWFDRPETLAR
jgi:hypothetical protein